jgi:hypothetical protein
VTVQQAITIEDFPRPEIARQLSPNGRAHWAVRQKARRTVVDHVTAAALRGGLQRMRGLVVLHVTFVYGEHRTRDQDNLTTGVMKALIDCLVKGGWLAADDMTHLRIAPVDVRIEKGRRAVELRFEERSAAPGADLLEDVNDLPVERSVLAVGELG